MKVNRLLLKLNEKTTLEDEVDFSNYKCDPNHVKSISNCKVKLELTDYGEFLACTMRVTADVVASCAYTLDDVPLKVKFTEKMTFTSNEEESDDEIFFEPENEINMDDYVLSYILANVPHNVHKPGAKLPEGGNGYRVLTEEEYLKEKANKKQDSPFDVLDDLEF